jgi:hypothetical protein
VRLFGFAVAPDGVTGLHREITAIRGAGPLSLDDVHLRARPYCDAIVLLQPLLQQKTGPYPDLSLVSGSRSAHSGEYLKLDVRAPDFDGYIYIDYFDEDGEVLHLYPNPRDPLIIRAKRNRNILDGGWLLQGSPGEQLVSLIAAKQPLFADARKEAEKTADYLTDLAAAIARAPSDGVAAALFFFELDPQESRSPANRSPP